MLVGVRLVCLQGQVVGWAFGQRLPVSASGLQSGREAAWRSSLLLVPGLASGSACEFRAEGIICN